ncbi:MAG: M20/M25/M40 family metallo-hydrolase [Filimonas sp.]|nr:M20/M25/M40 family metallo-hydrolase [Filimonas sp.]
MKQLVIILAFITVSVFSFAQSIDKIINKAEVERIEKVLSADDMQGRLSGTPGNEKAAAFIASEFKKAGLQTTKGADNYLQHFTMVKTQVSSSNVVLDNNKLSNDNFVAVSPQHILQVTEKSDYATVNVKAGDNFFAVISNVLDAEKNTIVWVDTSFTKVFSRLKRLSARYQFATHPNLLFVLTAAKPTTYRLEVAQEVAETKLMNVVGILPGKSKPNEFVIFSGHYDHLGIETDPKKIAGTDSIYNGANDDAAGTTAVIMLAKYFKALNNNERTIVFAAFTAEELGGFGSQYFSKQFDPAQVMAMFNIEMIGTESNWGKNSAYITGYEKTDMGKILEKNLTGTNFKFYPDPYVKEQLFYRSDNATLARLGVPAHTISTSKMDNEPNYHKLSDEIGTLDMANMAEIIKAIAISSKTIIQGTDTPSRVNTADLK